MAEAQVIRVTTGDLTLVEARTRYYDTRIRKARKPHRCRVVRESVKVETYRTPTSVAWHYEKVGPELRGWDHGPLPPDHTPTIPAGADYVEYTGEADPWQSGERYCLGCAVAAGILAPITEGEHHGTT